MGYFMCIYILSVLLSYYLTRKGLKEHKVDANFTFFFIVVCPIINTFSILILLLLFVLDKHEGINIWNKFFRL